MTTAINSRSKKTLSILVSTVSLLALQAMAAEPVEEDGKESRFLEEIVITSTKTGGTLAQDAPVAITALSAAALEDIQYENILDVAGLIPSLSVNSNSVHGRIYIRGIGTNLDFQGSDPSIAFLLDGVYLARPHIFFADFIDIERVEVLRGPQGTLYGRNAAGGIVSVVTKKPDNDVEGKLSGEYGSYDKWRLSGNISGPLVEDRVFASLAVMHRERDGYSENATPGGPDRLNDDETTSARGTIRITPGDDVEINLAADYYKQESQFGFRPLFVDAFGNPVDLGAEQFSDPFKIKISIPDPLSSVESYGFSGQVKLDINDRWTLTSITAYRELDSVITGDTDFTELDILLTTILEDQRQFSQDIQLQGRMERLNLIGGLYYFNERGTIFTDIGLPAVGIGLDLGPDLASRLDAVGHTDAYAAYAQGTYDITDRLSATAGIRYNYEKKDIDIYSRLELSGVPLPDTDFTQTQDDDWSAWTPKFGLDYKIDDAKLLYASVTKGFKSGGYNATAEQSAFDPESVWAYEVGLKTDWLEKRLRVNASAFYYDYTNLQIQGNIIPDDDSAVRLEISNATNAEVKGLELEVTAQATDELLLSGTLSYLDAQYKDYITSRSTDPDTPIDVTGNRLNNAPKWMYSLAAQYTKTIDGIGTVSVRGDFRWQDDVFYTVFNDPAVGQGSYGLLNGMVSWESMDEAWKVTVYGKNLTDKLYYIEKPDYAPTGIAGAFAEPRVFGVTLDYRF